MPNFLLEKLAKMRGHVLIAGVDEAGRGPLAGPVVAGAVILPIEQIAFLSQSGLDDSKKLSSGKREQLFQLLLSCSVIGVGIAEVDEIDSINILQASFLAMERAVGALSPGPDYALVDGNKLPNLPCSGEYVVKGDCRSLSIAAASIVAKVRRDLIMRQLAELYPGYGWDRNAGYGTAEHKSALERLGVTEHHRKSYAPINKILSRT